MHMNLLTMYLGRFLGIYEPHGHTTALTEPLEFHFLILKLLKVSKIELKYRDKYKNYGFAARLFGSMFLH